MDQKQENKRKVVGTSKKKKEKVIFSGTVSNAPKVGQLAQYLWINFDRTRLNDNWNDEIPQRQVKWISHADYIIKEILKK